MIFLNYEEWSKEQADYSIINNPKIECPSCNGEGVIYDECDCCGHDSELCCDDCNETGLIHFNEINEYQYNQVFTKKKYLEEIEKDFTRLANYKNIDLSEIYFNNGFIAFCSIHNKNISLVSRQ